MLDPATVAPEVSKRLRRAGVNASWAIESRPLLPVGRTDRVRGAEGRAFRGHGEEAPLSHLVRPAENEVAPANDGGCLDKWVRRDFIPLDHRQRPAGVEVGGLLAIDSGLVAVTADTHLFKQTGVHATHGNAAITAVPDGEGPTSADGVLVRWRAFLVLRTTDSVDVSMSCVGIVRV